MLLNSNELEHIHSTNHSVNDISIRWGVIGAGQKGNKEADLFAGYKFSNGTTCYPTLAVNFAESDMMHLQNIIKEDRIHFDGLKGAARTPSVVTDLFDPETNPNANGYLDKLAQELGRKFTNEEGEVIVDQFLICLGAGGGVGTGWGSLVLQLIREQFFPSPVSMLISLPSGDPDEINNALVLLSEIDEFMREQDRLFGNSDIKPLANVIVNDNTQMQRIIESQKGTKDLKNRYVNWKEVANDNVVSTLHEINIIPENYGSDNVTYDPSDLIKLLSIPGRFLTIGKARIAKFDLHSLENSIKRSLDEGFFSAEHQFETATMYGGFVLRPSNADFFKDVNTENRIRNTLGEYKRLDEIAGKFGDPIWDNEYAVCYTIFAGMTMPKRYISLAREGKELAEKQEQLRAEAQRKQDEEKVDISFATNRVQKNTFNPYNKNQGFGGASRFSGGKNSAFKRQTSEATTTQNQQEEENIISTLKTSNPFKKR
ncbi:cell division protein FtsZ [Bacillus thuringiensis]|uniref:cell division protein FtsZ n=1 Tax=Bacillus thuringiensis TaxID=1428 RepID=UPI000B4396AE|nr:cell division protein FtsZ [Bacillus thuringiensis]OTY11546.1 cell division protein FtsZ [Bacillus thuringiensis serovar kim]OUB15100.1 cell division protein FtsZ [Bacillus thuringiensis serovar xiaguangiensis]